MIKPFPYQKDGIKTIDSFDGKILLAWDMGIGKTLTSLWWLEKNKRDRLPAVVVCPASVKYQWEHEAGNILGWKSLVAEGRTPSDIDPRNIKLIIINYDILFYWLKWLKKLKAKSVVIDECQFCKESRTRRTKATRLLCRHVPNVLALSGTPMLNRPMELFPILNLLVPQSFPSRWLYGQEYCGAQKTPWGWQFKGATKRKELNRLLISTCMSRVRKSEVLKDLPPKMRQVVPMALKNQDEYQRASDDFIEWLKMTDPDKAERALNAVALTRIGHLLRLAAKLKFWSVKAWVDEFLESDQKLVLFCQHRKMIDALKRQIKTKSVIVDGRIRGRLRQAAVDQFQNDRSTRLLIGNKAAEIGLNLTAASNVAHVELPWTPSEVTQREDRCHRIGQIDTVWVYFLVAKNTIEEKLCEIIQKKQGVVTAIIDGRKIDGDLDVFNKLVQTMKQGELKWN